MRARPYLLVVATVATASMVISGLLMLVDTFYAGTFVRSDAPVYFFFIAVTAASSAVLIERQEKNQNQGEKEE